MNIPNQQLRLSNLWWALPISLSLLNTIAIIISWKFLPSKLPLFYSLPWGPSQLVSSSQLLILPATFLCISLINLMIYLQLHPSQAFFGEILKITSLVSTLILIIAFVEIVLIFL